MTARLYYTAVKDLWEAGVRGRSGNPGRVMVTMYRVDNRSSDVLTVVR